MIDRNKKAPLYLKGTVSCFAAFLVIWITAVTVTHPEGTFSYTRYVAGILCWLLAVTGTVLAFFALRASSAVPSAHLLSVTMVTLNLIGAILGTVFLIAGLIFLNLQNKLQHTIDEGKAKASTNAVFLAFAEFRSNRSIYLEHYANAAQAFTHFEDLPVSSLKSHELLASRGTNFESFMAAGLQLRQFLIHAPDTFRQEVENSGQSPQSISNALRNFKRSDLHLWDEYYTVLDKTLQMTSNTLLLNNLLASNFDRWQVSKATIVFEDVNLQADYLETAAKVRQFKSELSNASEHLIELQRKRPAKVPHGDQ
jgi:hypothetical protein